MSLPRSRQSSALHPPRAAVVDAVARALSEDLLPAGDITASLLPGTTLVTAELVSRQEGILAGSMCVTETFAQVDPDVSLSWRLDDGASLVEGSAIATVNGLLRSVITAERTALNFLCHLSGVATLTERFVEAVSGVNSQTRVWDTRKTTPGLRSLEKAAVRAGGGYNHRASLSEGILIKDNHLAGVEISEAVKVALDRWPGRLVEVECDTPEQVLEAIEAGTPVIMLDNMTPEQVKDCVSIVRERAKQRVLVEVSGRVTLDSAPALAAAGADLISVGAITHSAPVLDIGLDLRA